VCSSDLENEISNKLNNIGDKLDQIGNSLDELLNAIYSMEEKIVSEFSQLNYTNQESFRNLNDTVVKQLESIDSSINFNNLLTGIQTYQLYKINKNTKRVG
jgi:hypothetical protein